jgi:hypothetical protein
MIATAKKQAEREDLLKETIFGFMLDQSTSIIWSFLFYVF